MFRCRRYVLAALVVVGSLPYVAMPAVCAADESGPLWPHVWELKPEYTVQLRGRIDTDAIWSDQSVANEAIYGDLGDVVGLRRARVGVEGDWGHDRRYVYEIDLASGEVVPRDIYFGCGDRQAQGEYQFGHFREPFSFEGGTSARFFAFLERSPINVLDPARNWGVGLYRENPTTNSALAIGVFQAGTGAAGFQSGPGSTVGFTGRLTTAPINEGNGERLLHFGVAFSERIPEDGVIRIKQQPRTPLLDLGDSSESPFVATIQIPARFQQLVNLQFAAARGPFWVQSEWYGTVIDQIGAGSVFYRGSYVDCGYFLTGEHRSYDSSSGTLGEVRVREPFLRRPAYDERPQGWGAWEIAARFSYLDFIDGDAPVGPTGQQIGTRMPQSTLGMNWYLSDRVMLMFNYSYNLPAEVNTGTSAANIYSTRLAVYW